jgi:hypothetical protein
MNKLYKVAQKLNTTSEAIKELIKKKEISFEKKGGIYYVDENEVKSKIKNQTSNLPSKQMIINSVSKDWKNDTNNYNIHFDKLNEEFSNKGLTSEEINFLSYKAMAEDLYSSKRKYQFAPSYFGKYAIVIIKDIANINDGFYFVDNEYLVYLKNLVKQKYNDNSEIVINQIDDVNSDDIIVLITNHLSEKTIKQIQKDCFKYTIKNNILHLTINEFIKEFSHK